MLKNPESSAGGGGVGSSEYEVSRENNEKLSQEELEQLSDAVKERSEEVSETGEMTVIEPFSKDSITIDGNGWAEMHKAAWDDETTKDERFRDAVLDSVRKWNATNADERRKFLSDGEQEHLGAKQQTELTQDDISRLMAARLIVGKLPGDERTYESATNSDELDSEQPVFEDVANNSDSNNTAETENPNKATEVVDTPAEKPEMTEAERLYQLGDAAVRDPAFIAYMTSTEGKRKKLKRILETRDNATENLNNMFRRATNPIIKRNEITTKGDERKKPLLAPYYEQFLRDNGREDEIPEGNKTEVPSAVSAGGETVEDNPTGENTGDDGGAGNTKEESDASAEKPEDTAETETKSEGGYDILPFPTGNVEVEAGTQETREKAKSLKERFKGIIKRVLPLALLVLSINPMTMRKKADNVRVETQRTAIVQEYVPPTEETIPGRIETATKELHVGDEGYAEEMMKNLKLGDTISVPSGVTYNESSWGAAGHPGAAGERTGTTGEVDIRPAGEYTVDRATTWDANNITSDANYADVYDGDAGKKIADLSAEAGVDAPQPIIHLDGVNSSEAGGQTGWVKAEDLDGAAIINKDGKPETYTVEEEVEIPPETRTTPGYYQDVESTIDAAGETTADEDKMTIEVDGQAVEINFHREDGSIVQVGDVVRGSDGNDYQITNVVTTPGETRPQLSVLRLLHNVAVAGAAIGGTIAANSNRAENNEG